MKYLWLQQNKGIYLRLSINQRINFKNDSGVSLSILMYQHPDVLTSRINRFK